MCEVLGRRLVMFLLCFLTTLLGETSALRGVLERESDSEDTGAQGGVFRTRLCLRIDEWLWVSIVKLVRL